MRSPEHPTTDGPARWRQLAACRGMNPALFYDPHPASIASAKRLCARCPVCAVCDAVARDEGEEFGVWGGRSADERAATAPRHRERRVSGPPPWVSDDELRSLFAGADPDQPALGQLLAHRHVARPTAYQYLARAVRLGVVERRGRGLYPARP